MTDLIPDYDELTVEEVEDWLDAHTEDISEEDLHTIKEYEAANKDRVTVHQAIDDLLEEKSGSGTSTTTQTLGEDLTTAETSQDSVEVQETETTSEPPTVYIRPRTNLVAGEWYDSKNQVVEVRDTVRLQTAIDAGRAELVSESDVAE